MKTFSNAVGNVLVKSEVHLLFGVQIEEDSIGCIADA